MKAKFSPTAGPDTEGVDVYGEASATFLSVASANVVDGKFGEGERDWTEASVSAELKVLGQGLEVEKKADGCSVNADYKTNKNPFKAQSAFQLKVAAKACIAW